MLYSIEMMSFLETKVFFYLSQAAENCLNMNISEEKMLFEKIQKGDIAAFETVFHRYYGFLCLYASRILNDREAAEEIVQDFFVRMWEKKENLSIETSLKSYLFRSVKNQCLNIIQHEKIKSKYAEKVRSENIVDDEDPYVETELARKIEESINSLPEKRREIFRLSREEGLKNREIAEKLNISVKTVETQITLAIRSLREQLKKFMLIF